MCFISHAQGNLCLPCCSDNKELRTGIFFPPAKSHGVDIAKNIAIQILGIGSNGIVSWLKGSHGVKPMARLGIPTMVLVLPCALVLPIRTHLHQQ